MYEFVNEKWVISIEPELIQIVDKDDPCNCYSYEVPPNNEFVNAYLNPPPDITNALQIETVGTGETILVKLRRIVEAGLSLKLLTIEVNRSTSDDRLVSEFYTKLTRSWNKYHTDSLTLQTKNTELSEIIENMVKEKSTYQEGILAKVSSLLNDRNAKIAELERRLANYE